MTKINLNKAIAEANIQRFDVQVKEKNFVKTE